MIVAVVVDEDGRRLREPQLYLHMLQLERQPRGGSSYLRTGNRSFSTAGGYRMPLFRVMCYREGAWDGQEPQVVEAQTAMDAAEKVSREHQ